jgi:Protein of unknown function (DUF1559)
VEQVRPSPTEGTATVNPASVKPADDAPAARPWQFSLRHLLAVMAAVCVAGAAYQWIGPGILLLIGPILIVLLFSLAISHGKWLETLVVAGVLLGLMAMCVLPNIESRTPGRRAQCQNNLRQISIALQNYHDVYKSFPPAYVADANGRPMHSWRVLILPFLEQQSLYDVYRFDEPWNGPNNRQLASTALKIFECPADGNHGKGQTSYVAVVGPGTAWPGTKRIDVADIKDGLSNTVLVVEVHNSGIHWMEPRDLDASLMPMTINAKSGKGISSGHPSCAQAARADGSVFALDENTPAATVRAMLTIAGGEKVSEP